MNNTIKKEDFIFKLNNLLFNKTCIADNQVLNDVKKLDSYDLTEQEKNDISKYIKWCFDEMVEKSELLNKIVKKYDGNSWSDFDINNLTNSINILSKVTHELKQVFK
ncbi:hypothetical protein ACLGL2_01060 [Parvimonas sp. G1641]|uniref:hypothetical protein n=1 Tax=Parvimonas sp. G1641 TaxID=3388846 RepID=UPI0039816E3E